MALRDIKPIDLTVPLAGPGGPPPLQVCRARCDGTGLVQRSDRTKPSLACILSRGSGSIAANAEPGIMNMNSVTPMQQHADVHATVRPAARLAATYPADAVEALEHFRMIFRSVRRHFHALEEACGINGSQVWALAIVVQSPGIRVKDLARGMAVQQSTASNLVEQLARRDLLRRARDQRDQRIVLLYPTATGEEAIARAPQPLGGILPEALAQLGPKRLVTLNRLLQELVVAMRIDDSDARHVPIGGL